MGRETPDTRRLFRPPRENFGRSGTRTFAAFGLDNIERMF